MAGYPADGPNSKDRKNSHIEKAMELSGFQAPELVMLIDDADINCSTATNVMGIKAYYYNSSMCNNLHEGVIKYLYETLVKSSDNKEYVDSATYDDSDGCYSMYSSTIPNQQKLMPINYYYDYPSIGDSNYTLADLLLHGKPYASPYITQQGPDGESFNSSSELGGSSEDPNNFVFSLPPLGCSQEDSQEDSLVGDF